MYYTFYGELLPFLIQFCCRHPCCPNIPTISESRYGRALHIIKHLLWFSWFRIFQHLVQLCWMLEGRFTRLESRLTIHHEMFSLCIVQVKWETIDKFPRSRLQQLRFATTEGELGSGILKKTFVNRTQLNKTKVVSFFSSLFFVIERESYFLKLGMGGSGQHCRLPICRWFTSAWITNKQNQSTWSINLFWNWDEVGGNENEKT